MAPEEYWCTAKFKADQKLIRKSAMKLKYNQFYAISRLVVRNQLSQSPIGNFNTHTQKHRFSAFHIEIDKHAFFFT